MSTYNQCPVCKSGVSPFEFQLASTTVRCRICGTFGVTEQFLREYVGRLIECVHIYSGALREHDLKGNPYILNDLKDLRDSVWVPENPIEQIDKLLLSVERMQGYFGESIFINCPSHYAYAYAKNAEEFFQLIHNAHTMVYVESGGTFPSTNLKLLWRGAERLSQLHKSDVHSNQAFVAMWFHPRTNEVFDDGIKPALESTGFKPLRIDRKEFNLKIDDEIVASIRQSGLVIADVTGHRQGVYYEAGYAMGLGIPVIWTCCEKFLRKTHFDTRQFNHIVWTTPNDLRQRLINRIEATRPTRSS